MKSNHIEDDVPRLDELKSHVYGMGASMKADQYAKTTKAIAEYVGGPGLWPRDEDVGVEGSRDCVTRARVPYDY